MNRRSTGSGEPQVGEERFQVLVLRYDVQCWVLVTGVSLCSLQNRDTHTHTHTHTHTRDLHILFHVLDTTTVVFIFPLCIRSFISLRIFFLFHHIFCFKPILFFILFFLLFSFVPSSDLFRNSFQIPQFFSPPLCSILPCFHSFLFASLSFVALTIICLYFFYIHSRPFLF